jgi:general L-amino acid transport system permease protein
MSTADLPATHAVAEKAPLVRIGALRWLRENLFNSWLNAILTVLALALIYLFASSFIAWGLVNAVWSGAASACEGKGACWAVLGEKGRFILFGRYAYEEQYRPALFLLLFIGLVGVSTIRRFWSGRLALAWAIGLVAMCVLMWGGVLGLPFVSHENWGGLPLTVILAVATCVFGFPLGIVLALGRRSRLPAIRAVSVGYIELVRGVPLITVLFMAAVMFPLFLPPGFNFDKLLRTVIAFILFSGAYLAEVVRGGLQALPKGQAEAADALGLSYWQKTGLVVLPQALRLVIPALVNTFIATFKDTSLVITIGLFDLLSSAKTALNDPVWRSSYIEVYLFVALIYFGFCFFMSRYSQNLEGELRKSARR